MIAKIFYGPWDWLIMKTSARDRRAFGGWTLIGCIVGSVFFGNKVWWIAILSLIALVPNVSSETPVEQED
jgi:hypothetical protein